MERVQRDALVPGAEADAVTAQALQAMSGAAEAGHLDETTPAKRLLNERLQAWDERTRNPNASRGRPTTIARLDELTGGLHGGQMVVLAGREGDGKSALAAQISATARCRSSMSASK